jgi:hypothetical protein
MHSALETRIRAAGAEMSKPGHWRLALEQLTQAATQILASPESDVESAQLALDQLFVLYQWSSVMSSADYHRLNQAVMQLSEFIANP